MGRLIDRFGREINYLRISITDRCNFRCIYCMPEEGVKWKPMEEVLRYEEMAFFAEIASSLGISRVKLTGGEPLVRKGVCNLIAMLSSIGGIKDISLTTNGSLLEQYADRLKEAGLSRVTVSLDTLDPDRFRMITRRGHLVDVLRGFDALDRVGFENTKINVVLMKSVNDAEVVDIIDFGTSRGYDVRFIEFMPTGLGEDWRKYYVPFEEVKRIVESRFRLEISSHKTNGPSVYYKVGEGYVGFITPLSKSFCSFCNRIRLSSDGKIIPCLGHSLTVDVKEALRKGDRAEVEHLIKYAVELKPKAHSMLNESIHECMSEIGG